MSPDDTRRAIVAVLRELEAALRAVGREPTARTRARVYRAQRRLDGVQAHLAADLAEAAE